MKRKNKLPRYYLGTRLPNSLGYQPNYGIGNTLFTSTPGDSINPETASTKSNILPNVLSKGNQYGSFLTEAFKNTAPMLTKSSSRAFGNYLVNSFNEAVNTAQWSGGQLLNEGTISSVAPNLRYAPALNTAGTVMAGIGAAYGLTDMGIQLANNKQHRSPGDMRNTLSTNINTTDMGNTYTTYGGPDSSAELAYAKQLRLSKNANFFTTAVGTGASIGTLIEPGIGTAIGAGVGALFGGGAHLLGFGDTEEQTKNSLDTLTDSVSMENRMSTSRALDKDVKQLAYSRIKSGSIAGAALGKESYGEMNGVAHGDKNEVLQGPDGYSYGKATSMGMPGEIMYNTQTKKGNVIKGSGNGDTEPLSVEQNDATAIYSKVLKMNGKSFAEMAAPYVESQNKLHKIIENAGGSNKLKLFQIDMAKRAMLLNDRALAGLSYSQDMVRTSKERAKYKCGKLPKYSWADKNPYLSYGAIAVPNILQSLAAYQQYNRDKNMPVDAKMTEPNYGAARNDIYRAMANQPDVRPILNDIDSKIYENIYGITLKPGLGMGGRALFEDSVIRSGMKQKADIAYLAEIDRIKNQNTQLGNLANIDAHAEDMRVQNYNDWAKRYALASGAKYSALAQDYKNLINPFNQMIKDWLAQYQFDRSDAIKQKMINLFENSNSSQESSILADLYNKWGPNWASKLLSKSGEVPLFHQKAIAARKLLDDLKNNTFTWRGW